MVHFSSTALAAAIRAFFFSSFKSCMHKMYNGFSNIANTECGRSCCHRHTHDSSAMFTNT